ncbi:MAG: hypothetical protein PHI94_05060 [Eubacteriaceae bacterium]|jgi:chromosome segregation ATPase|nr:hypothetical protein [Eubacteriaceae bacterium]
MPRPKGSKNRHTSLKNASTPQRLDDCAAQIEKNQKKIEAAQEEIDQVAATLKEKRSGLQKMKREQTRLFKQQEKLRDEAAEEQREQEAQKIAKAFMASGKSADEILAILGEKE